jgi:hypothetical protein
VAKDGVPLAGKLLNQPVGPVARASDSSNVAPPLAGADAPIRKPMAKDGGSLAGTVGGHWSMPAEGADHHSSSKLLRRKVRRGKNRRVKWTCPGVLDPYCNGLVQEKNPRHHGVEGFAILRPQLSSEKFWKKT